MNYASYPTSFQLHIHKIIYVYVSVYGAKARCNNHKFGTLERRDIYLKIKISTGEQLTIAKFMLAFQHQKQKLWYLLFFLSLSISIAEFHYIISTKHSLLECVRMHNLYISVNIIHTHENTLVLSVWN